MGIEGKIEKVRKRIEESTGGKNRKHLNKVEKLHQKLRYLEYYRDNAVIPVREASKKVDSRKWGKQGEVTWCWRCNIEVDLRSSPSCEKCERETGQGMRHFRIESEETILSEVRKSVRRDFDAMVRSEKQIKSKLKSGKRKEIKKELRERSKGGDW